MSRWFRSLGSSSSSKILQCEPYIHTYIHSTIEPLSSHNGTNTTTEDITLDTFGGREEGGWYLMVNFFTYLIYNWLFSLISLNKVLRSLEREEFYINILFCLSFYLSMYLCIYLQVPCLPFFFK